jgi:hypothetical protein
MHLLNGGTLFKAHDRSIKGQSDGTIIPSIEGDNSQPFHSLLNCNPPPNAAEPPRPLEMDQVEDKDDDPSGDYGSTPIRQRERRASYRRLRKHQKQRKRDRRDKQTQDVGDQGARSMAQAHPDWSRTPFGLREGEDTHVALSARETLKRARENPNQIQVPMKPTTQVQSAGFARRAERAFSLCTLSIELIHVNARSSCLFEF